MGAGVEMVVGRMRVQSTKNQDEIGSKRQRVALPTEKMQRAEWQRMASDNAG